ncbi:MAG TPA: hypothetical protein VF744_07460 [Beijerinckiaceae bacterium]|jgi:hypothetical protein
MKRRDAIGILAVSLFLIAVGVWSLVDAFATGETYAPKSFGHTVRPGGGDAEFGLIAFLDMAMILAGVIGLFVYVTRYLGREGDR